MRATDRRFGDTRGKDILGKSNQPTLTETALAKRLGFSRATVADWRVRYLDAPAGRDLEQWRTFVALHDLGRSPNRQGLPQDVRQAATEALLAAEGSLYGAERILARADPERAARFLAVRRKVAEALGPAWSLVDTV